MEKNKEFSCLLMTSKLVTQSVRNRRMIKDRAAEMFDADPDCAITSNMSATIAVARETTKNAFEVLDRIMNALTDESTDGGTVNIGLDDNLQQITNDAIEALVTLNFAAFMLQDLTNAKGVTGIVMDHPNTATE